MRVLIVGPIQSPIMVRLIGSLRKEGVELYLASHNASEIEGVFDLGPINSMFDYFRFDKISSIVKKVKPDLIHAHGLNHYGLMCIFQPLPLLIALWGSDVMLAPYEGTRIKRLFYKLINWFALKRANRCHTSSSHIAEKANIQSANTFDKTDVFYWGIPLLEPSKEELKQVKNQLEMEFSIESDGLLVFPRGLGYVYNPDGAARILEALVKVEKVRGKIVVLKGFSTKEEEISFFKQVDRNSVIYIDRLLNDVELYYLYTQSEYHFSIPISDALGGGVIEPSILGSYPILSNISPYQQYIENHGGYILKEFDQKNLRELTEFISKNYGCYKHQFDHDIFRLKKITCSILNSYELALKS
jgi:hypothetical protein